MHATPVFGAPMEDTEQNGGTAAAAHVSDAPQDLLDPNDPRLVSEDLNANPDADAYAQPAPPPDGRYRVKLKLAQKEVNGQKVDYVAALWGKKGTPQAIFVTGLEAGIIDPTGKYDGLKAYDYNVSTFVGRDNATKVTTIVGKLRQPSGQPWAAPHSKMSAKLWMELLVRALAGEPELGIETTWEYSCQACGEEAKKRGEAYPRSIIGMHKFPPEQDRQKIAAGQRYSPEMKCVANPAHGYGRARITIARFLSLDELKGAK